MARPFALLLAGCAVGMGCSLAHVQATDAATTGSAPPQPAAAVEKASPFAGAKDETSPELVQEASPSSEASTAETTPLPLQELSGTKAAGTKKASPFAGAKETDAAAHADLRADRRRLWWLALPVGLALVSYRLLLGGEQQRQG
jgi:hypothetical protein